ncbi:MAG TPA: PIG-L family deacetylase [Stellaceae bacterium]|nr:PIG-L family deacetylase [Stellaceae bacterium]
MQGWPWPIEPLPARAIVIGAHPDDEVIGAGALLARLPDAAVIHVTDGAPRNESDAHAAGFAGWADYAAARHKEAEAALALAGLGPERLTGLGIADQQASQNVAALAQRLAPLLQESGFSVVITHAYEGGHPDHDATALAVHAAGRLIEASGGTAPRLVEMAGYHALGGRFAAGTFITHADAGPAATVALDAAERRLKRRMLDCHETQRAVLAQFTVEVERFRAAPRYDFRLPPHPGPLHYDTQPWGITGEHWRGLAQAALEQLGLSCPL